MIRIKLNLRINQSVSEFSPEERVIERFRNVQRISENELDDLEKKGVESSLKEAKLSKNDSTTNCYCIININWEGKG